MGIWDAQPFEQALHATVLAPAAVQGVEGAIDPCLEQLRCRVFPGIDLDDIEAFVAKRARTAGSRRKAHLPFRRTTAQQHSHARELAHGTPTRLISHSSSIPNVSFTRARTSSPTASISAAVASPELMRKLQCFSETCAAPCLSPRQPA